MNNLRIVRKKRGLSQLKLSYMTGMQPGQISMIENNRIVVWPGWKRRLAEALRVAEGELFPGGEEVVK